MGLVRFALVAVLLVLLIKKKIDLGIALIIAAAVLGLMYTMGVVQMAVVAFRSAFTLDALEIIAAVVMIVFLSELMRKKGKIKTMVASLRQLLGDPRGWWCWSRRSSGFCRLSAEP